MALTINQKERIREEALRFANRYTTRYRCAVALRLTVDEFETAVRASRFDVISDAKWIYIAQKLGVNLKSRPQLQTAATKVVLYLTEQFEICQREQISGIFCDIADSGKTEAARHYVATHPGSYRIDCSLFKNKRRLINEVCRQMGVPKKTNYWETYDALVWQINNSENTLIILDEAGDLQYEAFLEVKGLWNATEGNCAWFMLGADALRAKIERGKSFEVVGFHEIFSRLGAKYQSCIRKDADGRREDILTQAAIIAKANTPAGTDIQRLVLESEGSLRRLAALIEKENLNVRKAGHGEGDQRQ